MLALKSTVPLICKTPNSRGLLKNLWLSEGLSFSTKNLLLDKRSRCLDYQKALEKCPKPSLTKRCRRTTFADNIPQSKCNWSNADDYRRAYQAIKLRSEKLGRLAEDSTRSILEDIVRDISKICQKENSLTKRILQSVEPKVDELSSLDPVCGMKKKYDVLMLNDRTQQELNHLHQETRVEMESIECEINKLKCDIKSRASFALNLVSLCRNSKSPQALIECVEHSTKEAAKILDEVKSDFDRCFKSIKNAKEEIIKEDEKRVHDVTHIFESNMAKLISGIVDCITARKSSP